jgi:zinc and cadmium transporter
MTMANIFIYSMLAGTATLIGTWIVLSKEGWARKNSIFLISFAAGIMLATAFSHLIPEATELYKNTPLMVFAGFLVFYVLQQMLMFHACHDDECKTHRIGTLSAIGLTIHSLLDGVAIAVGFEAGWSLGILTTLAVLLHELPEGITITGIMIHSNANKTKTLVFSIMVALATPLGAIVSYFFLKHVSASMLGVLLAFTAGSFIYLAASDLLPETHREHNRANAIFFFLGVAVIVIIGKIL